MERLTKRLQNGKALCIGVCEKECVEGHSECHKCKPFVDVIKKLAEYEDAEEQGLLLRLPCKVGDTLYRPIPKLYKGCNILKVTKIYVDEDGVFFETDKCDDFRISAIGKTMFLTIEEAEQYAKQKLEDMKKG